MNRIFQYISRLFKKARNTFFPIGTSQREEIASTETPREIERKQKIAATTVERPPKATEVEKNINVPPGVVAATSLKLLADLNPEEKSVVWGHSQAQTAKGKRPTVKQVKESIRLFRAGRIDRDSLSEEAKESRTEPRDLDYFREHLPRKGRAARSHRLFWEVANAPERERKMSIYISESIVAGVVTKSELHQLLDSPEERKAKRKRKVK